MSLYLKFCNDTDVIMTLVSCVQYCTVHHITMQYNAVHYNTIQYNTMQYYTIQCNTVQYNARQYNAIQYNVIQCNTIKYNTTQHTQHFTSYSSHLFNSFKMTYHSTQYTVTNIDTNFNKNCIFRKHCNSVI